MIITLPHIIARKFSAVTIYPFIFVRHDKCKSDYVLINHEKIHIQQQKELLWIGFFILYLLEYFAKLLYYRNSFMAYKSISFEREAYVNENDLDYLLNRRWFSSFKFL
jgi:hypothetical protein